jgi:GTP-binding protein
MDFFDRARILVKAGNGGNGSAHFHREKFNLHGGPDGGDGGRGGSIYFEADPGMNTLVDFHYRQRFRAEDGGNGQANRQHGKAGDDLILRVPSGTLVRGAEEHIIADLTIAGQRAQIARGGRGGLGNVHFATSTNQAPREAQRGEPGEELEIIMELKLLADVGLVGLPNAGKSTLLSVITAARPKIANYPFTTLIPNLGVVVLGDPAGGDSQSFVVADIPGLIEGAAEGKGLGHDFLRHIERTRLLLHLIDGDNLAMPPWDEFNAINAELRAYRVEMADLPQIIVFSKMDLPTARDRWPEVRDRALKEGIPAFAISSPTQEGLKELVAATAERLRELPVRSLPEVVAAGLANGKEVILRPQDDTRFTITREAPGLFVVRGKRVDRMVAMTDTESEEGRARLERHLRQLGVFEVLEREGIQPGDSVRFGTVELEWGDG